jgi:uncharacterized protein YdeI (YjbR/CyaY-like superfamily)
MSVHDKEHLDVTHVDQLVDWLHANHSTSSGLWVVYAKKTSGLPGPTYDEMVRAILRFGWVDSIPGKVDAQRSKLYVSPRKPTSAWSQSNKVRVDELIASGLMLPAGLAAIDLAKENGSWSLIDAAQNAEIPDDLESEFRNFPGARENFDAFPRGVRKQILEWISLAKTPPTRAKRVAETAELAGQNIRANQWRGPRNVDVPKN